MKVSTSSALAQAEQSIETRSESLKKPLGLVDLVLTQVLFVLGSSWVGAAAKLGQAHLSFGCSPFYFSIFRRLRLSFT
jgi:hypothetical protein